MILIFTGLGLVSSLASGDSNLFIRDKTMLIHSVPARPTFTYNIPPLSNVKCVWKTCDELETKGGAITESEGTLQPEYNTPGRFNLSLSCSHASAVLQVEMDYFLDLI